ncbi:hypothetical protein WAI453_009840 [Rhynchosporium graminicola]
MAGFWLAVDRISHFVFLPTGSAAGRCWPLVVLNPTSLRDSRRASHPDLLHLQARASGVQHSKPPFY